MAHNSDDYSQLNVEAGFQYAAGAFVPDGPIGPVDQGPPVEFAPNTRPGHHIPHVWLRATAGASAEAPVSTIDLVRTDRFTLFVDPSASEAWTAAASDWAWPVEVVVVADEDREWAEVRQVGTGGAVLVRPDRKVAWRVASLPANPPGALRDAMRSILSGGFAQPDDPAEPFLRRIRAAAASLAR